MPYAVTYLDDVGVVETVYAGNVTPEELDAAITATGALAAEHLCNRFLVDAGDLGPARGATLDILKLAELLASVPPDVIEREAILPPRSPGGAVDMRFFETAARNRGLNVRVFGDRDEALAWLSA